MTILARLQQWKEQSKISPEQHAYLAGLSRGEPFSLFLELNVLLYAGVLSFVAGLGSCANKMAAPAQRRAIDKGWMIRFFIRRNSSPSIHLESSVPTSQSRRALRVCVMKGGLRSSLLKPGLAPISYGYRQSPGSCFHQSRDLRTTQNYDGRCPQP